MFINILGLETSQKIYTLRAIQELLRLSGVVVSIPGKGEQSNIQLVSSTDLMGNITFAIRSPITSTAVARQLEFAQGCGAIWVGSLHEIANIIREFMIGIQGNVDLSDIEQRLDAVEQANNTQATQISENTSTNENQTTQIEEILQRIENLGGNVDLSEIIQRLETIEQINNEQTTQIEGNTSTNTEQTEQITNIYQQIENIEGESHSGINPSDVDSMFN